MRDASSVRVHATSVPAAGRPQTRIARRRWHAVLEQLEQRQLLSSYIVTSTADSGAGSLRAAITQANTNPGADTIAFDIAGAGTHTISLATKLPAITGALTLDGSTQPGYTGSPGVAAAPVVAINGQGAIRDDFWVAGLRVNAPATIRAVTIYGFLQNIYLDTGSDGSTIEGCYIGTTETGMANGNLVSDSDAVGIIAQYAGGHTIGGLTADKRNVIAGNGALLTADTVEVANVKIIGNYIGVNATGTALLNDNASSGAVWWWGGDNNQVGGTEDGAGNVIASTGESVGIGGTNVLVQNNRIGVTADGTTVLAGMGSAGIDLVHADHGRVIGNLIGGVVGNGISVDTSSYCTIQGNVIGTDLTCTRNFASADSYNGIYLSNTNSSSGAGSDHNVIGGASPGEGNVVGFMRRGIRIGFPASDPTAATVVNNNTVLGNYVGVGPGGQNIGNRASGIFVGAGSNNIIGGVATGEGNHVACNGSNPGTELIGGVLVTRGSGNTIRGNSIHDNAGLGIDLGGDGITANDPGDADTGANGLPNFPIVTGVAGSAGTIILTATLQSTPSATFTVDFYAAAASASGAAMQGRTWIGSGTFSTDASGLATGSVQASWTGALPMVVATATDAAGNTSEFSAAVGASAPTDISLSSTSVAERQHSGAVVGILSSTDSDVGDTFSYSLVAGAGSTDNGSFQISGNQLKTAATFDFETRSSYSIRVRTTDAGGLFCEKTFSITVVNVPKFGMQKGKLSTAPAVDADGDAVTFSLTGGGSGTILPDHRITLTETTAKSVLTISVKKVKSGDGYYTITGISADGPLKSISAAKVFVNGQIAINTAAAGGVASGATPYASAMAISLAGITDGYINTHGFPIAALKLLNWQDTDGMADQVVAPSIGTITVSGRRDDPRTQASELLAGDWEADVSVGAIKSMSVAGVIRGDITATGAIGIIAAKSISGHVLAGKDAKGNSIGKISMSQDVSGLDLRTDGLIGSVSLKGGLTDSRIQARDGIKTMTVASLLNSEVLVGVDADFGQDVIVRALASNAGARLGTLTVAGRKLPAGQNHGPCVVNSNISAPIVGTVSLLNVPVGSAVVVHVLDSAGTLKVSQTKPVSEQMVTAGTWKKLDVHPAIWQVVPA